MPTWRQPSAGTCSSSSRQKRASQPALLPIALLLTILAVTACSSASRVRSDAASASKVAAPDAVATEVAVPAAAATSASTSATSSRRRNPGDIPAEALDLLTQSTKDSCSICAETRRKKAFDQLDEVYRPGTILSSTQTSRFMQVRDGEDELTLTSFLRSEPRLTFRFHSASNHLVGIAADDYTDEAVVQRLLSTPPDTAFAGRIAIVAYAYGDRATYLYSSSKNHLQVQCKILELTGN